MFIHHKKSGFTLIEMLVAMSIGLLITITVTAVAISSLKYVRTARALERLHSNAFYITDTISNLIKQSASTTVPGLTTLKVTAPDLTTKTITLAGGQITIDTTPITYLTSTDVSVLYFRVVPALNANHTINSIRVGFTLKSVSQGKIFFATTTFARRNSI